MVEHGTIVFLREWPFGVLMEEGKKYASLSLANSRYGLPGQPHRRAANLLWQRGGATGKAGALKQ